MSQRGDIINEACKIYGHNIVAIKLNKIKS